MTAWWFGGKDRLASLGAENDLVTVVYMYNAAAGVVIHV